MSTINKIPILRYSFNRKKTATDKVKATLYFEVQHLRQRRYVSTGLMLLAHQWSQASSVVVYHPDADKYNNMLEQMRRSLLDAMTEMCQPPLVFDIDAFVAFARGDRDAMRTTFLDFMEDRIGKRSIAEGTRKHHYTVLSALSDFGRITAFSDVTPKNIALFDDWLRNDRGIRHQPTIYNYHKTLRPYVADAISFGLLKANPYDHYRVKRGEVSKIKYLTQAEVDALRAIELEDETLRCVRDLFVLQIYTGLAYADMYATDYSRAERRADGRLYVRQPRIKTNEEYYLLLLPPVVEILERYGYRLPQYSNQKYNTYLKALGLACGITKPITSHVARHTFATTITLSNKVPIQIVAKMMGHSDIKTTQRYAKVLAEDVIDAFKGLEEKL